MSHESTQALTQEERLKAIVYQFISLYERWSEDRQLAAKQGADTAALIKTFTEQVEQFKTLEPEVRRHIVSSIQRSTVDAANVISEKIRQEANHAIENTVQQLADAVERAERVLHAQQKNIRTNQWKIITCTVLTTLAASLLLVWLLMPKPVLPLTPKQMTYLSNGQAMEVIWPTLSKKERAHFLKLVQAKLKTIEE